MEKRSIDIKERLIKTVISNQPASVQAFFI